MKKVLSLSIVTILFLISVGCAKMPLRGDYVEEKSPPQMQADAQSAAIIFFREWAFTGGGMSYFITEDTNNNEIKIILFIVIFIILYFSFIFPYFSCGR